MNSNRNATCQRYNSYLINNQTFLKISTAYEGIPQNLAINFGVYCALIGLFIILRKNAFNYGKLAWLNKPISLVEASMRGDSDIEEGEKVEYIPDDAKLIDDQPLTLRQRILKRIPLFIKMSDEQLSKRCGSDAVIYCQFQRYLMVIVAVMMCFSLLLILPLNLNGGLLDSSSQFAALTIGNVTSSNQSLWFHFTVALTLMLFAFFLSNRFLKNIDVTAEYELSSTIMITNVPLNACDESSIKKHFSEAFPSIKVRRVQVTHKVDQLIYLYTQKVAAEEALCFCYNELESTGQPVMVVPQPCGRMMACKCCTSERCTPVDGIEFYKSEVVRLNKLFIEEKSHILVYSKLPILFVTFGNLHQASLVRKDYAFQNYCCLYKGPSHKSSLSRELKASQWRLSFAPLANDILWQNLHKTGWKWWIPVVLVNLVIALIVIILSTPSMVLNLIVQYKIPQKLQQLNNPIIAQFVPSLILVLVNALMPIIVYWSDQLSGHWTLTNQTMAVMNKLYAILVTTVLVLPSLGLNSIPEFLKWLFPKPSNTTTIPDIFRWECIFMPDGGALFCNYMITASFIGTALELLRFGELFLFVIQTCYSKSRAEDQSIAQNILWEFPFGLGYAWTLALFSMISAYAVIVPIITPFGLVYLLLKHLVDRYNIIHVNIPSDIDNSVHANAAQLMQIGLILTQATVTVYVTLRRGTTDALSICCYIAFLLGVVLTFGRTTRRWVMTMSCYKYSLLSLCEKSPESDSHAVETSLDGDGFILVDDFRNSMFLPRQLSVDEPSNIEEILTRKPILSEYKNRQDNLPPKLSYGSN